MADGFAVNYVLLAWVLAAVVRVAQGSATVAMITSASIMLSIAGPGGFGVHPFYIFLAIGYGATTLSWMNDSGFWVVCKTSGLTEVETLRTYSVMFTIMGFAGFGFVMLAAYFFPMV